jgi:hypothetical protein
LAQSGSWCLLTKLGPFVGAPGLGTVAHKMLQAIPRVDARTQQIIYDTDKMAGEVSE